MRLLLFLFIPMACFSQKEVDSFEFTPEGINGYRIVQTKFEQDSLYRLAEKWVKLNFKSEDYVFQTQIENELIRFDGNIVTQYRSRRSKNSPISIVLTVDLHFNEDRVKFSFFRWTANNQWGDYSLRQGLNIDRSFFSKRGKLIKRHQSAKESIEKVMNGLFENFEKFLSDPTMIDNW